MMTKILLFIPFYNCEKQIKRVLKQVEDHHHYFSEVLFIDNVSQDKGVITLADGMKSLNLQKITLIRNNSNYSLGGSHKVAFKYALEKDFTHVVVFHGDDQGSLVDVIEYIKKDLHLEYDCLLGSRFHSSSMLIGYSKFRTLGNIVLNGFCSIVCKNIVSDMGSGLNMYNREIFKDSRIRSFPDNLTFNVYLLFHSYFTKTKLKYFPITWKEEDQVSNAKVFTQFRIIMLLITKCILDKNAIYKDGHNREYSYEIITRS